MSKKKLRDINYHLVCDIYVKYSESHIHAMEDKQIHNGIQFKIDPFNLLSMHEIIKKTLN